MKPENATNSRYIVIVWLSLAALIAYICRNSVVVAESTIRQEFELTTTESARIISFFFLTYALFQLPTGWFANRLGSRISIPVFAVLWSFATAVMGFAAGVSGLILARMANGVAQAGLFPASVNTLAKWMPVNRRGTASGGLACSMSIGGAVGAALAGYLIVRIGWRWMYFGFGLLGVVWAVLFYWWFRDRPEDHRSVNQAELDLIRKRDDIAENKSVSAKPSKPKQSEPTPWLSLLLSPATWFICGQQFCRAAGQIFFASWFATFLQETYDTEVEFSGYLTSIPLLTLVLGGFLGGTLSDFLLVKTGSLSIARKGLAAACMLSCALLVLGAYSVQDASLAVFIISAGTFCAAVGGPCAYTITIDLGGSHVATLFGLMNMIGNLGALAFINLVPAYVEATGNWSSVLLLFTGFYLGAFCCWLLINPARDIFEQSFYSSTVE